MGDTRFDEPILRIREAEDRQLAISALSYDDLILALGGASRGGDTYLANILTSELLNRSRRVAALIFSAGLGVAAGVVLLFIGAMLLSRHPHNFDDHMFLFLAFVALALGAIGAALLRAPIRRQLMRGRA